MVYSAEKTLKDLGDKVPDDIKQKVDDAVGKVREVKDGEDLEAINKAADQLTEVLQQVGQAACQQQQAEGAQPDATPEEGSASDDKSGDDDVVDGEFKQV